MRVDGFCTCEMERMNERDARWDMCTNNKERTETPNGLGFTAQPSEVRLERLAAVRGG